jgi:hypothetical protein
MDATLLKRAMIGTDKRYRVDDVSVGRIEVIEGLADGVGLELSAWQLLLKAGCYAVAERAGYLPENVAEILTEPARDETQNEMSKSLADVMLTIMKEYLDYTFVSLAFLKRLVAAGKRLPVEMLPAFLQILSQRVAYKEQSHTFLSLFGERGIWLSRQNVDWQWLTERNVAGHILGNEIEELWNEGNFKERESSLQLLRQNNPNQARAKLTATWKSEKAEHREAFLKVFAEQLDNDDIPLLEQALVDRSKNVRQTATLLLAKLPDSDFAKRARTRAESMIVVSSAKGTGKKLLEIVPPFEFTKEMKADGIDEKPPKGVGERAWWLSESVGLVPISYWESRFEMKANELLDAFAEDDFFVPVLRGLTLSVLWFGGNDAWLESLWDNWDAQKQNAETMPFDVREQLLESCMSISPIKFWNKIKTLKSKNTAHINTLHNVWQQLVAKQPVLWDNEFTNTLLDYIETFDAPQLLISIAPLFPREVKKRLERIIEHYEKQSTYHIHYAKTIRRGIELRETFDLKLQE